LISVVEVVSYLYYHMCNKDPEILKNAIENFTIGEEVITLMPITPILG
jgi:hypothetical protein